MPAEIAVRWGEEACTELAMSLVVVQDRHGGEVGGGIGLAGNGRMDGAAFVVGVNASVAAEGQGRLSFVLDHESPLAADIEGFEAMTDEEYDGVMRSARIRLQEVTPA